MKDMGMGSYLNYVNNGGHEEVQNVDQAEDLVLLTPSVLYEERYNMR